MRPCYPVGPRGRQAANRGRDGKLTADEAAAPLRGRGWMGNCRPPSEEATGAHDFATKRNCLGDAATESAGIGCEPCSILCLQRFCEIIVTVLAFRAVDSQGRRRVKAAAPGGGSSDGRRARQLASLWTAACFPVSHREACLPTIHGGARISRHGTRSCPRWVFGGRARPVRRATWLGTVRGHSPQRHG